MAEPIRLALPLPRARGERHGPFHLVSSNPAMIAARAVDGPWSGTARAPAARAGSEPADPGDVRFSLRDAGRVDIDLFNVAGQRVAQVAVAMVSSRRPVRCAGQRGWKDTGQRGYFIQLWVEEEPHPEADHRSIGHQRSVAGPRRASGPHFFRITNAEPTMERSGLARRPHGILLPSALPRPSLATRPSPNRHWGHARIRVAWGLRPRRRPGSVRDQ